MPKNHGINDFGPLPSMFGHQGPHTSTSKYLLSWAAHAEFALNDIPECGYDEFVASNAVEFLPRLEAAITKNKLAIDSSPHEGRYYIIHPDLTPSNVLFDDQWNLVAVIDWELSFTAPLEIFAVKMANHYYGDIKEEMGRLYLEDLKRHEEELGLGKKLSATFGSILGGLANSMNNYEAGMAFSLLGAVEKFERSYRQAV